MGSNPAPKSQMSSNQHPIFKYLHDGPTPVKVRRRYRGGDQAHKMTLADSAARAHRALIEFAEAMARFQPRYTRRERLAFKVQELRIVAHERAHEVLDALTDVDPVWPALMVGGLLVGIVAGVLASRLT